MRNFRFTMIDFYFLLVLIGLILLIVFGIKWGHRVYRQSEPISAPVTKPKAKQVSAFQKEFGSDTAMLNWLHDTLVKREGYSATIYKDKKGFYYIGAGHQLLKCDTFTRLTLHQADSLLWVDIKLRYYIVQQQRRNDIYLLYISGHFKY